VLVPNGLRKASFGYALRMGILTSEEARQRAAALPGWTLGDKEIHRKFTFRDFPAAVSFVVRVGFAAEAADHHPDILINYKRVTLTFSTHSEGGLTEKDFAGAEEASRIATVSGAS
jgi:4a-hydroxytetrahydrobiopterin dehydratase